MFQTIVVEKIETHVLCLITLFQKSCSLWDNFEKYCRARWATDETVACTLHAGCLRLQRHTHVILIALQQRLHEHASMLRYTYIACHVVSLISVT